MKTPPSSTPHLVREELHHRNRGRNSDPTLDEVSGDASVIHLQATRDVRDEAIETADEAGVDWFALRSRRGGVDFLVIDESGAVSERAWTG